MKKYLKLIVLSVSLLGIVSCESEQSSLPSTSENPSTSEVVTPSTSETPVTSETPTTSEESSKPTTSENTSEDSKYDENGNVKMDAKYQYYYANLDTDLSGDSLKYNLKSIVSKHDVKSYGSLAQYMKKTDRDWTLSPDPNDSNPYMRLIYASYNGDPSTAQRHSTYGSVWDKEHIWCKSKANKYSGSDGISDLHHLRASDKPNNNNWRNSRNLGNATNGTVGKDYLGKPSGKYTGDNTKGIFEPVDQDKGDVARAIFYMATVYPNNCRNLSNSPAASGTTMGILDDLLEWNKLDPVDEFEMNRNNIIFDEVQHNRNPYVDFPNLVDRVFAK